MIDAELTYLKQFLLEDRRQRLEQILQYRTRHLTVLLENVFHDQNASACLRTVECFGVQDVHVIDSYNDFRPNREVALGASKWLTFHHYQAETKNAPDLAKQTQQESCYRHLREKGYRILATSPRPSSVPLPEVDVDQPTAIVFGTEQTGVSEPALNDADGMIHIPMSGFTESFNISVAVGIVLQHCLLQLHRSEIAWQLSSEEQQTLLLQWVKKSLGNKYEPLKKRFDQQAGGPN
ncbi:MAG: RNA methyltransferase [Fuerstiella sp.]